MNNGYMERLVEARERESAAWDNVVQLWDECLGELGEARKQLEGIGKSLLELRVNLNRN